MPYKCISCKKGVRSNSKAVSCDGCGEWCHIRCGVPITLEEYIRVSTGDSTFDWVCPGCMPPADQSVRSEEPTLPVVESTRLSGIYFKSISIYINIEYENIDYI